jgi:hypothetical protein
MLSALGLALYAGAVRLAEGRWPSELGLKQAAPELLIGLVVGTAMLSAVVAACWRSASTTFRDRARPRPGHDQCRHRLGILRGADLPGDRAAAADAGVRDLAGAGLSAALFGALHLTNPNATPVAAIAIAVEAGLMLASFYLLTGRLWVSIGVHAAWNFTQGWIWGARVSGIPVKESLYLSAPKAGAPDWLSGGAFGPEASVPAMVIGTGVAVVVLYWAWKKGNFKARSETRSAKWPRSSGSARLDDAGRGLGGGRHLVQAALDGRGALGQGDQGRRRVLGMVGGQLDQLTGQGVQLRRGGDQPGLELDLARIAVVLGPGRAPAAPVVGIGDHHRIGAGIGMVQAVAFLLPLVAGPQDAPVGRRAAGLVDAVFRLQLVAWNSRPRPTS